MKKFLILLFAVFLLVSFTSCDTQKKIDEAVEEAVDKALAEQMETMLSIKDSWAVSCRYDDITAHMDEGKYDLSLYSNNAEIKDCIIRILADSTNTLYNSSYWTIKSASGTVSIVKSDEESDDNESTLTLTGVSIEATYTYKNKEVSLTLDGEIYRKLIVVDDDKRIFDVERKMTGFKENGTQYKDIELSYRSSGDHDLGTDYSLLTFKKAVCDGKDIDVDFMNTYFGLQ